ncbi:hypothetical protein [Streptococcus ruminantium]|uniref:Uncharacterized protein n=1 Tax=Streptococcus ruminantium TaxID=1917441 RepID=A0ABU1B5K3_9STRE|nr:hypothetical protein [Streptococcus ruminantium]MDQ8760307.1 hypothetical protein [Streptococcus ruminantium]MDQ8765829.1 hypothetical protein [Streptococcus ruminantium]MDQ8769974.1 hypothetical protein [Streptococcus ruminantium]MDQ8775215.1 hypothetical protein [Streptococcus ruminantium]MDQ8794390.1 hypothetical protein [Streptococcus ruminantium]
MENFEILENVVSKLIKVIETNEHSGITVQLDTLYWLHNKIITKYPFEKINIDEIIEIFFPTHGGLTDYYVWLADEEKRILQNREITDIKHELFEILKQLSQD